MKKIVTIGGGTGSYTVLSGLKNLPDVSLTALVSMADDGGSSGRLREKWKVMPPGDVRQCLAALSEKKFLNRRFTNGFLKGHTLGNILLAVLEKMTGDFIRGLNIISWVLKTKGKVIPITKNEATLKILFSNGDEIVGEGKIDQASFPAPVEKIYYKDIVKINPSAGEAILNADYILIGPGNFYCSLLPNLLVDGFKEAIKKSKAKVVFILNLVNKQGHTMNWGKAKYLQDIEKYLGKPVDFILDNSEEFSSEQRENYLKDGGEEIFIKDDLKDSRVIKASLLSGSSFVKNEMDVVKRSLIRHDSSKLASCIKKILYEL